MTLNLPSGKCCPCSSYRRQSDTLAMSDLVFLTRDGCVQTDVMRARLDEALRGAGRPPGYAFVDLATLAATDPRIGYPTPTVLVGGRDLFGMEEPRPPFPEPT